MDNTVAIVGDLHLTNSISSRVDNVFETCIQKLKQILEHNKTVIFLGDMFHSPTGLDNAKLLDLYLLFKEHQNKGGEVITIIGNHDVISMNENSINRTHLGLLDTIGIIKVLKPNERYDLGNNVKIQALPLNFKDIVGSEEPNIFLGHHFYGLNCADSLSEKDVNELFPNRLALYLGHDHEYHEPINKVYRSGSLLRNAATEYNKKRKIVYYRTTVESIALGVPPIEVEINCLDGNKVFIDNSVIKKRERYIENLERTIQLCSEKVDTETRYSIIETLKELKAPREAVEYLVSACNKVGVNLK